MLAALCVQLKLLCSEHRTFSMLVLIERAAQIKLKRASELSPV